MRESRKEQEMKTWFDACGFFGLCPFCQVKNKGVVYIFFAINSLSFPSQDTNNMEASKSSAGFLKGMPAYRWPVLLK